MALDGRKLIECVCPVWKTMDCDGECTNCEEHLRTLISEHNNILIDEFTDYLIANTITLDSYDKAIIRKKAEEWKGEYRC